MTAHPAPVPVPVFLRSRQGPLPARVVRQVHLVPPDRSLDCPAAPWAEALALLEAGCVEIRTASGRRLHLCPGAIFSLRGLVPAVLVATGPDPAVVHTLHHRTEGEGP